MQNWGDFERGEEIGCVLQLYFFPSSLLILRQKSVGCINQYDTEQPTKHVNSTHLSSRDGHLNLYWTDPDQSPE